MDRFGDEKYFGVLIKTSSSSVMHRQVLQRDDNSFLNN